MNELLADGLALLLGGGVLATGWLIQRRERRRPRLRIVGRAAAHPVPPLPTRTIHIRRVLAALAKESYCDER